MKRHSVIHSYVVELRLEEKDNTRLTHFVRAASECFLTTSLKAEQETLGNKVWQSGDWFTLYCLVTVVNNVQSGDWFTSCNRLATDVYKWCTVFKIHISAIFFDNNNWSKDVFYKNNYTARKLCIVCQCNQKKIFQVADTSSRLEKVIEELDNIKESVKLNRPSPILDENRSPGDTLEMLSPVTPRYLLSHWLLLRSWPV